MFRANCFDFRNDLVTSETTKFHFLYSTTEGKALKLRNCAVGAYAFVPLAVWLRLTQNGNPEYRKIYHLGNFAIN